MVKERLGSKAKFLRQTTKLKQDKLGAVGENVVSVPTRVRQLVEKLAKTEVVRDPHLLLLALGVLMRCYGYAARVVQPKRKTYVWESQVFLSVTSETGKEYIVDTDVLKFFQIAKRSPEYEYLLRNTGSIFVGTRVELDKFITSFVEEMRKSFSIHKMEFPPWRETINIRKNYEASNERNIGSEDVVSAVYQYCSSGDEKDSIWEGLEELKDVLRSEFSEFFIQHDKKNEQIFTDIEFDIVTSVCGK